MHVFSFIALIAFLPAFFHPYARTLPRAQSQELELQSDIFRTIEQAIAGGSVASLEEFFGRTVTIRVLAEDAGRVSGSQARSILTNFFRLHKPISFSFTKIDRRMERPYATGRLVWIDRGMRRDAQVFVAVQRLDGQVTISHFNVY